MRETASNPSDEPIHLDAASGVIGIFLERIYTIDALRPAPRLPSGEAIPFLIELLDLCHKFDCPDLVADVYRQLEHGVAANSSTGLLRLASDRNDLDLAKIAIKHHWPYFVYEGVNSFWGIVDGLRDDWQLAFVRCLLPASKDRTPGGLAFATDWVAAAEAFNPGKTGSKVC